MPPLPSLLKHARLGSLLLMAATLASAAHLVALASSPWAKRIRPTR